VRPMWWPCGQVWVKAASVLGGQVWVKAASVLGGQVGVKAASVLGGQVGVKAASVLGDQGRRDAALPDPRVRAPRRRACAHLSP
jgi:hypothetical protein